MSHRTKGIIINITALLVGIVGTIAVVLLIGG